MCTAPGGVYTTGALAAAGRVCTTDECIALGGVYTTLHYTIEASAVGELCWGGGGRGRGAGDFLFHSLFGPVERKKPMTWAARVR